MKFFRFVLAILVIGIVELSASSNNNRLRFSNKTDVISFNFTPDPVYGDKILNKGCVSVFLTVRELQREKILPYLENVGTDLRQHPEKAGEYEYIQPLRNFNDAVSKTLNAFVNPEMVDEVDSVTRELLAAAQLFELECNRDSRLVFRKSEVKGFQKVVKACEDKLNS